jgi:hypothetical protein
MWHLSYALVKQKTWINIGQYLTSILSFHNHFILIYIGTTLSENINIYIILTLYIVAIYFNKT